MLGRIARPSRSSLTDHGTLYSFSMVLGHGGSRPRDIEPEQKWRKEKSEPLGGLAF